MDIYILEHVYEVDEVDEIKFIGAFSTFDNANSAIENLKKLPGFQNYPVDCFQISKITVDDYGWKEGFVKWEDAN